MCWKNWEKCTNNYVSYNKVIARGTFLNTTKTINPITGHIHTLYIYKVGDHSRRWPEGSLFDSLRHQGVGEGATPYPGLLHFTLDLYLIMLSVKQGGIKYHFLSLWYDSTWDWTRSPRPLVDTLTARPMSGIYICIYIYIYIY